MKFSKLTLASVVIMANLSFAQTPAVAPAATPAKPAMATAAPTSASGVNTVTALCKDGTSFSGDSKKGACSGHKGVKTWTSKEASKPEMKADNAKSTNSAKSTTPVANAAPGGGAGKVWVNSKSNTYHCSTDRYYGKTKEGSYMSEAEAKAKGAHADHGKNCA